MTYEDDILAFVAEYVGVDILSLSPDLTINNDLGLDGEDGSDFILAFAEKFDVDISNIKKVYFNSEGYSVAVFLWPLMCFLALFGFKFSIFDKVSSLPIKVLIDSAENKFWVDT